MDNHTVNTLFPSKTKQDALDCIAAEIDINVHDQPGKNSLFYNYHFSAIEAMIEAGINLNHTEFTDYFHYLHHSDLTYLFHQLSVVISL